MPDGVTPSFLLYLRAAKTGEWERVLDQPATPAGMAVAKALQELPLYENWVSMKLLLRPTG